MSLFHPVFNTENGIRILDYPTKWNNDCNNLILHHPSAQQTLDTPLIHKLIQPRKTRYTTNGAARFQGLGEQASSNTISLNKRHCGRESAYFANDFTMAVGRPKSLFCPILQLMAASHEEQRSGQNFDCLVEACDQQRLIEAPIIPNLLTQNLIDKNDDVYSGESVWKECDTSTPTSGENFERLENRWSAKFDA